jgi:CheY-like chemotaxis protein
MSRLNGRPAIILLAEDDPGDQELTRRAFEASEMQCQLYIVGDGEEALDFLFGRGKYARREACPRPDLVLLDLNMPKIDGPEVLQRIRADSDLRRMAVVALTTSRRDADIANLYDLGVNSYIPKPPDMVQFADLVRVIEAYWFGAALLPPRED